MRSRRQALTLSEIPFAKRVQEESMRRECCHAGPSAAVKAQVLRSNLAPWAFFVDACIPRSCI